MAKRFTDNNKWKKKFFKELPMHYKLLWLYILDDCDHAGIWEVDLEVAELRIDNGKCSFIKEECEEIFEGQIIPLGSHNHKWFIPDYISFQYGRLSANNRVHQSVIQILEKYNLFETPDWDDKPLIEVKEKTIFKKPSTEEIKEYCIERNNNVDAEAFYNYYESKGWKVGRSPMKSWKASVITWEKNNYSKPTNKIDKNLQTWSNIKKAIE